MYVVYKTTNLINGKIYIGVHKTNNPDDSYIGNGIKSEKHARYLFKKYSGSNTSIPQFLAAVIKYGYNNFKKETLVIFDNPKDALNHEKKIVNKNFVKSQQNYNSVIGGGWHGHSLEQKDKISKRMRDNNPMKNPEVVQKMLKSKKDYQVTDETKLKLSRSLKVALNRPDIRKSRSIRVLGKNNPAYDPTIFKFIHDTGVEFVGSCYDLFLQTGHKSQSNMWLMKKYMNKRKWKGWRIVEKCQNCGAYHRVPIKKVK